jgi:hypothetical protein
MSSTPFALPLRLPNAVDVYKMCVIISYTNKIKGDRNCPTNI